MWSDFLDASRYRPVEEHELRDPRLAGDAEEVVAEGGAGAALRLEEAEDARVEQQPRRRELALPRVRAEGLRDAGVLGSDGLELGGEAVRVDERLVGALAEEGRHRVRGVAGEDYQRFKKFLIFI